MNKQIIIIGAVLSTLALVSGVIAVDATITKNTSAVAGVDYKVFYYGSDPTEVLKGTDARYEVSGYPSTSIIISNWNDLGLLEQATIIAELEKLGYRGEDR